MESLKDIDWTYQRPQNYNSYIEDDRNFENSSTFKIINDKFHSPLYNAVHPRENKEKKADNSGNNIQPKSKKRRKNPKSPKTLRESDSIKRDSILENEDVIEKSPVDKIVPVKKKPIFTYAPGLRPVPVFTSPSNLTKMQHELCVKVLCAMNKCCVSMPATKISEDELQCYNNLIPIINDEQKLFTQYVREIWVTKGCGRYFKIIPKHENFVETIRKEHVKAYKKYPQLYKLATMFPLVYANPEVPIELHLVKNLENEVDLKHIDIPPLTEKHILKLKLNDVEKAVNEQRFSKIVTEDSKCEEFALQYRADIVISSNGLKILADNYPPFSQSWDLPILIKEYKMHNSDGTIINHNIVYVDHSLPSPNLTEGQKTKMCFDFLLKSDFLQNNESDEQKTIYNTKDMNFCKSCELFAKNISNNKNESNTEEENINDCNSSDNENDLIMDCPIAEKSKSVSEQESSKCSSKGPEFSNICSCGFDISNKSQNGENTEHIVKKILNFEKKEKLCTNDESCWSGSRFVFKTEFLNINDHSVATNSPLQNDGLLQSQEDIEGIPKSNFTYDVWRIGQNKDKNKLSKNIERDINVLVRCQVDGYEIEPNGIKQMYVIEPKIEYQEAYGAEVINPSEAIRQWTSLKFIPNSKLLRARIISNTGEVIMIEKVPFEVHTGETIKRTTWKPEHAIGCYFNIFSRLYRLPPGQYILRHEQKHHAFAVLFSQTSERCENGLDLEKLYEDSNQFVINQQAPWTPIDPLIVTPHLKRHNIMPCMFPHRVPKGRMKKVANTRPEVSITPSKKYKGKRKRKG